MNYLQEDEEINQMCFSMAAVESYGEEQLAYYLPTAEVL